MTTIVPNSFLLSGIIQLFLQILVKEVNGFSGSLLDFLVLGNLFQRIATDHKEVGLLAGDKGCNKGGNGANNGGGFKSFLAFASIILIIFGRVIKTFTEIPYRKDNHS